MNNIWCRLNEMNTKYWTDAQTSELIQLLEKNECLWNPSCPQYRDRTKRGLALAKMAIKLKHSAKQIRTKIKNLRSHYTTIRMKMQKTSSKKSPWKYYSALHFMFANADDINTMYDDALDVKENNSSLDGDDLDTPTDDNADQQRDYNNCTTSTSQYAEKDEYTIFGEFVASELRSLKDDGPLQFKLKYDIQRSILDVSSEYAARKYGAETLFEASNNHF